MLSMRHPAIWSVSVCALTAILLLLAGCASDGSSSDTDEASAPSPQDKQTQQEKRIKLGQVDTTAPGPPPPGGPARTEKPSPAELQQSVRNFADQYRAVIAAACDHIIFHSDDSRKRRLAHQVKLAGSTAMYDIAVDPLPAEALLNAIVALSLQSNALERSGDELFGRFHPLLTERSRALQEEIFRIAAGVMSNEQRVELLRLCNEWSKANPNRLDIWYVRLEDLPGINNKMSGGELVSGLTSLPAEFLNIFNPFSKTQDAASEASVVAERFSWLAPRLMILAQWRAEAVIYDALAATEVKSVLDLADRLTTVAETLPDTISEQREALFKDLAENEGTLHTLLTDTEQIAQQAKELVAETDTTVNSTTELLSTADQLVARIENMQQRALEADADAPPPDPDAEPARPFDVTEYTEAIVALNAVVQDTNDLLKTADTATSGQAINERVEVIEDTIADLIWLAGGVTLGVALAIILSVKLIPSRRGRAVDG